MVIILHEEWRVFSWVEEQDRGFPSSSFHFPSAPGFAGPIFTRAARFNHDLWAGLDWSTDERWSSSYPEGERMLSTPTFFAVDTQRRYFFLRTRITESRFSIDKKKKKNEERKKKRINLHISIKVDCPIITETSFKIKRKTHRNLKHFNLVQRKKYQKEIKLIRCREFKTRI